LSGAKLAQALLDTISHKMARMITRSMTVFGLALLLAACAKAPRHHVVAPPPPVPADRLQFEQGIAALREFTPDAYARAIEHFERASALAPDNCEYQLNAAQASLFLALEQKLNSEEFRPAWEKGADPKCAPETAFALRLDAFRLLDEFGPTRDRTALPKINQAIQLEPGNALNLFVRWKMTSDSILDAAYMAPDLALIQYEAGNYWLVKADYVRARNAFERALELSPKHFRSWIGLAQARSAIDEEEDIEPLYKRAVELAPNFLEGRILLGDYYSGLEENELAREQYLAALARNSRFEVGHLRLGLNYLQSILLDESEKAFQAAIEINPSSYEAYYYLGNISLARGNLDKAQEHYEQSLKFVLNFPEAVYALGTVFFRQGKADSALEQFEKVLRMNRSHADAYFSRAAIRVQRRQLVDAIEDCERALGLYNDQWQSITESIEQYEERGLPRKVEAERRKRERIEGIMERTRQLKLKAEAPL
jgi:tetratricopeptide (TPR) repeat protein